MLRLFLILVTSFACLGTTHVYSKNASSVKNAVSGDMLLRSIMRSCRGNRSCDTDGRRGCGFGFGFFVPVQGPQGDPGVNGTNGVNGVNGANGLDGTNGIDGAPEVPFYFDTNNIGAEDPIVGTGVALVFDSADGSNAGPGLGTTITKTDSDTYSLNTPGRYRVVTSVITQDTAVSPTLDIVVGGTTVRSVPVPSADGIFINYVETAFNVVTAPTTLEVQVGGPVGSSITLNGGNSSSIFIERLTTN